MSARAGTLTVRDGGASVHVADNAEANFVGALILAPDAWERVSGLVEESDIGRRDYRLIFTAVRELCEQGRPVDVATVADQLEMNGALDDVGGLVSVAEIARGTCSAANIEAYAEIVSKRARERRLVLLGEDIAAGKLDTDAAARALDALCADAGGAIRVAPPTLAEFLAREFPAPEQMIGPIGRQQIVLIASATGVGKTQLAIALSAALKNGAAWMHWESPAPRRVLYLDGEMAGRDLQQRFAMYPNNRGGELRIANAVNWAAALGMGHPNIADLRWQAVIERWAEGCDVVVVDNVMSLVSVPGVSMSSDEFWKPVYDWGLRQRAAGRTALILDHTNAQGEVFGTKTKRWNADLCLTLETPEEHDPAEGCRFTVRFTKTRGIHGQMVAPFEAKLLTDEREKAVWTHKWADEALIEQAWKLSTSGMSQRDIARELEKSPATVNRLMKKARKFYAGT